MRWFDLPAGLSSLADSRSLHRYLLRLRWGLPGLVFLLAAVHQGLVEVVAHHLPSSWERWGELLVYGLTGTVVSWVGVTLLAGAVARRAQAEEARQQAYAQLEARNRRLTSLYHLMREVVQSEDEQALLELAAQAPLLVADALASTIVTFDEESNHLSLDMAWGLEPDYLDAFYRRMEQGVDASRCRDCERLQAHVGQDCPLFSGLQPYARRQGIQSLVCVPIQLDGRRRGVLSAYYPTAYGPPEEHLRLLGIMSGAMSAALDRLRNRARQLNALVATLDRTTQPHNLLQELAAEVVQLTMQGWEAPAGALLLYEEEGAWHTLARRSFDTPESQELLFSLAEDARQHGGVVLRSQVSGAGELRSAVGVALRVEGRVFGALVLAHHRPRVFRPLHRDLLQAMGHQIALAVRNAQLYAQVHRMAVLEERYRLSREIHDGLAQTLSYLGWQAERLETLLAEGRVESLEEELGDLRRAIRNAYVEAREAIDGLRMSVVEPGDLSQRLREYAAAFQRQTGIEVSLVSQPTTVQVPPAVGLQVLRIVQEALANVRRHARATQVRLSVLRDHEGLALTVADNGQGMPTQPAVTRPYRSHGLSSMRERAEALGGTLTIATGAGQGTRILLRLPAHVLAVEEVA